MTIRAPGVRGVTRAYGQATVLQYRGQALVAAAGAAVTPYLAGTATPYPAPLYATADATEPLAFPVATGADGVVALWGDAPARLDVVASAPGLGQATVTLDLELPPDAAGLDAYTKTQSDARYQPIGSYLTPGAGDLRYEPLDSAYTKSESDARYATAAGADVTLTADASLTVAESPANTFALAARLSPDADNALALRADGLHVPVAPQVTTGDFHFQTNPAMTDPGTGNFRSNTGVAATATALALDQVGAGGTDIGALFSAMRLGDTVYVQDKNDATRWTRYQLAGAPTLNAGWAQVPVVVIATGGAIAGSQLCVMQLTMTAGGGGGGIGLATDALADAKGDGFFASANNAIGRLPVGGDGQVLTAASAESLGVRWAAAAVGAGLATDPLADAKGDLFAASGADAVGRLPLGTNGQVLTADSTQALGVRWAAAGAGGAFVDESGDTMTGALVLQGALANSSVLQLKASGDANPRFRANSAGKLEWLNPTTGAVTVALTATTTSLQAQAHVIPDTTNTQTLGSTASYWTQVYANNYNGSNTGVVEMGTTLTATAGTVRLRNAALLAWRNAGNSANLSLGMDASDRLALAVGAGAVTTTATTGAAGAPPAQVAGYLTVVVNGTPVKVAYWNP